LDPLELRSLSELAEDGESLPERDERLEPTEDGGDADRS